MDEEQRWQAVIQRDAAQDGQFLYGVMTTGVYCRPSCKSRLPLRRNLRFYADAAAARADGLRACKRCRPDEDGEAAQDERLRALCDYLEAHVDQAHSLASMARRVHLSPFHFQRRFKALIGVTPKQYVDAARMARLKTALREQASVTAAIQDAGFGSTSRVYEKLDTRLGMTPREYRDGGRALVIGHACGETALGLLMIGATDRGLCFLQFGDDEAALRAQLQREFPKARLEAMPEQSAPELSRWMQALSEHLTTMQPLPAMPVDLQGTAFQLRVWNYLQGIPAGELRSYAEVAEGIGQPSAVRAVATACANNRVGLLVPCHRVIRSNGELGGYRWGLARKRTLIDAERRTRAALRTD